MTIPDPGPVHAAPLAAGLTVSARRFALPLFVGVLLAIVKSVGSFFDRSIFLGIDLVLFGLASALLARSPVRSWWASAIAVAAPSFLSIVSVIAILIFGPAKITEGVGRSWVVSLFTMPLCVLTCAYLARRTKTERRNGLVASLTAAVIFSMTVAAPIHAVEIQIVNTMVVDLMMNGNNIIVVTTGTNHGMCTVSGTSISCIDGQNQAQGDKIQGCGSFSGSGYCITLSYAAYQPVLPTGGVSSTDVQCQTGGKQGDVYTLSAGDDTGSCGPTKDAGGRVDGGNCTKGGGQCASVSCETGCGTSSNGCSCSLKSKG